MTQGPSHNIGAEGTTMTDDLQSWDEVETKRRTPLADELRDFADKVADVEKAVGDDGEVDVYFVSSHSEDTYSAFSPRTHEFTAERTRVDVVYDSDEVANQ